MVRVAFRRYVAGVATVAVVFAVVHYSVVKFRRPGSMTVLEAQAMDMSESGTPLGATPVAAEMVKAGYTAPTVTYTGSVVAFNDVDIYPRVTGTLLSLSVYPGDHVIAGQVVARLDGAELASRLAEADALREAARHETRMSAEERRQAAAQKRSAQSKSAAFASALQDSMSQRTAAEAMRDQAEREQEALQASLADAEAGVTAVQADVDYWTRESARQTRLLERGFVSKRDADRAETELRSAQAKLKQSQAAVQEKRSSIFAAQAKVRQAEANIASTRARTDQARADFEASQADATAAAASLDLNIHHTLHRAAMESQAAASARTAGIVHSYTEIRAPESGVVTERLVSPGTLVQPGMAILRIKNIKNVRLQANVADADLSGIRIGSPVTATISSDPTFRLSTRVSTIFNAANPQSRTVIVEALAANPGERLHPGQYVIMEIATGARSRAISVPAAAVQRDENQRPFVWTIGTATAGKTIYRCVMHPEVQSDKPGNCWKCGMPLQAVNKGGKQAAQRRYITVGKSLGQRIAVESGLVDGDSVIYKGYENLAEGTPVAPVDWGAEGPARLPTPNPDSSTRRSSSNSKSVHAVMPGMQMSGR